MPISTTLRAFDGGIYINADGLRTDRYGVPLTDGAIVVTSNPNGSVTASAPAMAYSAAGSVWIKTNTGLNNTGWQLIIGDGT